MRGIPAFLTAVLLLAAACQPPRERVVLHDLPTVPDQPKTVSVLGDWVLATPSDSTVFAGARLVEMRIGMADFTIRARYPGRGDVVVTGEAHTDGSAGPLRLVPRSVQATAGGGTNPVAIVTGQPISLIASAAGQTLVFGHPDPASPPTPSSVWHRQDAARAAGMYEAAGEVVPEPKPRP